MIEEGFHCIFKGYYKRLGADPSVVIAKEASEFMENIGIILEEKLNALKQLITVKDDYIKALESRELRITPISEEWGQFTGE